MPALQVPGDGADEAAVLPVVEGMHGRGEAEDARPGMAEDEHLHVAPEGGAVPAVMGTVHERIVGGKGEEGNLTEGRRFGIGCGSARIRRDETAAVP